MLITQPVDVCLINGGFFELLHGLGRLKACKRLSIKEIPAVFYSEKEQKEILSELGLL